MEHIISLFQNRPRLLDRDGRVHVGSQQQVAIAAAHMPHIAAYIGNDMRLKDQCNIATISAGLEPRFDDGQKHGRNLT